MPAIQTKYGCSVVHGDAVKTMQCLVLLATPQLYSESSSGALLTV